MAKVRSYASAVEMRLGIATVVGRLAPIRAPRKKETEFKLCTPDTRPVRQVYIDDEGKIYEREELSRARVEDDVYIPVNAEEVEKAKESLLPLNIIDLTVHPAAEINKYLFPSDNNAYIFEPVRKSPNGKKVIDDPVNDNWYNFINIILRDNPDIALMGKMNLQGYEGLFRLGLYQGLITVQRQLYPEDLNQFDFSTPDVDLETRTLALEASRALLSEFEPESYRNSITERLAAIKAGTAQPIISREVESKAEVDFKEMLKMMVKS